MNEHTNLVIMRRRLIVYGHLRSLPFSLIPRYPDILICFLRGMVYHGPHVRGTHTALAWLAKHATGGDARHIVASKRRPKRQDVPYTRVSNAVVDLFALAARLHQATPAQASQMR